MLTFLLYTIFIYEYITDDNLSPRLGICGFVRLFAQSKFEDLYECNFYKMIRKIKLQLICIIEHMLLENSVVVTTIYF
jgi:hypothetical protein